MEAWKYVNGASLVYVVPVFLLARRPCTLPLLDIRYDLDKAAYRNPCGHNGMSRQINRQGQSKATVQKALSGSCFEVPAERLYGNVYLDWFWTNVFVFPRTNSRPVGKRVFLKVVVFF